MKQQKRIKRLLILTLLVGVCFVLQPQSASAATFAVTNTNDSGGGSLRQAFVDANANSNVPHTIQFNIPGPGQHAIELESNLPMLTRQTLIDATSQPGSDPSCEGGATPPRIALVNETGSFVGAEIRSGSELRGFAIGADIAITSTWAGNITISCNYFGTLDGQTLSGESRFNQQHFISGSSIAAVHDNVFGLIGGVSSNFRAAVLGGTTVKRNYFGIDSTLTHHLKDEDSTHWGVSDNSSGLIGGTDQSDRNYFYRLNTAIYAHEPTALGNIYVDNGIAINGWGNSARAPIIRNIQESGGSTQLEVELDEGLSVGTYWLEFYENPARRNDRFMTWAMPDQLVHGLDATEYLGAVTVVKTEAGSETVSATIPGTGYEHITLTATQDLGDGNYGDTTPLGHAVPKDINLSVSLDTGLGENGCFTPGASGAWSIEIINNGAQPLYELGVLLQRSDLQDYFDISNVTIGGPAQTDWLGYNAENSDLTYLMWEGALEPGQHLVLSLPATYSVVQQTAVLLAIAHSLPPDVFKGTTDYMTAQAVDQHASRVAVACHAATDLSSAVSVSQPIVPGGSGTYNISITNHGPADIQWPVLPDYEVPAYMSSIALPEGSTPEGITLNGQEGCIVSSEDALNDLLDGAYIAAHCAGVACVDYSTIDPEWTATVLEVTPYGTLLWCFYVTNLPAGSSVQVAVTISASQAMADDAAFAVSAMPTGNLAYVSSGNPPGPFDTDVLQYMNELIMIDYLSGNTVSWDTQAFLLVGLLGAPLNNSAHYIGLGTNGVSPNPPENSTPNIPGSTPPFLQPIIDQVAGGTGQLADTGRSHIVLMALAVSLVCGASYLLYRRKPLF